MKNKKFINPRKGHQGLILGENIPVVKNGEYAIIAKETGRINEKTLETIKKQVRRASESTKKKLRLITRVYFKNPFTKKPLETRMGGGKGAIEGMVAKVRKGSVLFELCGNNLDIKFVLKLFKEISYKLPLSVSFVDSNLGFIK